MKNGKFKEFEKRFIGYKIDENYPDLFHFSLKKANDKIHFFSNVSESNKIINSGLLDFELIDGYEAIYSTSHGIVECQLGNLDEDDYEKLCCYMINHDQDFSSGGDTISIPPSEIPFKNDFDAKISIGYYSKPFNKLLELKHNDYVFKRQNKFTLKISNAVFANHDEAKKVLEEIGNSLLFEICINYYISIILHQDQPNTKRNSYEYIIDKDRAIASETDLGKLKVKYPSEPTSYFLKANIMHDLKFYQFLLYYHCLEYYFPNYTNSQNDKEKIVLKRVITDCIQQKDIINFINNRDRLVKYFKSTIYKKISKEPIYGNGKTVSIDNIALRIYDIRCAIVHKKNDPRKNILYPSLQTFELIKHDNELLNYIAENIIKKHSSKI